MLQPPGGRRSLDAVAGDATATASGGLVVAAVHPGESPGRAGGAVRAAPVAVAVREEVEAPVMPRQDLLSFILNPELEVAVVTSSEDEGSDDDY